MSTYTTRQAGPSQPVGSPYLGDGGSAQPVYKAPAARGSVPAGVPAIDNFNGPGSMDVSIMDPAGSAEMIATESQDVFLGLKSFLFGTDQPDVKGEHGGLGPLGWGPIGAGLRFGAEVATNVAKGAVDIGIGALERIPAAVVIGQGGITHEMGLQKQFDSIPDDDPGKIAALAQIEVDRGLFGTGALSGTGAYMSQAVAKYNETKAVDDPDMWSGTFRPAVTVADVMSNMFGGLNFLQRGAQRVFASVGMPGGQEGRNRLQQIMAVGAGKIAYEEDKGLLGTGVLAGQEGGGLNPIEQEVFDRYGSGEWTADQALDFLTQREVGYSHTAIGNIAGSVLYDPLNVATLGAGVLAKMGTTGLRLSKTLANANRILNVAKADEVAGVAGAAERVSKAERAVELASQGVKNAVQAEGMSRFNVVGKVKTTKASGDALRVYGAWYGELLGGTKLGKAAKITRTVIDPMHAVDLSSLRMGGALTEGAAEVTKAVVMQHNELNHIAVIRALADLSPDIAERYGEGLAIYSGNALRRVAGRGYRATQMMGADKGRKLVGEKPWTLVSDALSGLKKNALVQLEEEAGKWIKGVWSAQDDAKLAKRMETLWGGRSADEWLPDLAKMNGQQKSLLHASTYGSAVKQLHEVRSAIKQMIANGEDVGEFTAENLDRLILLGRDTLTKIGHEGIMKRMEEAADNFQRLAIIEEARATYPALRGFVVDPTSVVRTVDDFNDMMGRMYNRLPNQIRDAERGTLPEPLRAFDELITPSADPTEAIYTIGFRPEDRFLWGLEDDADGVLREVGDPWMDQVSDNLQAYAPVREVSYNVAGVPILGDVAVAGAKMLDHAEALGRMALHGTTGTMVTQAARGKFIQTVEARYVNADGTPALTRGQVENIWKALMTKVRESENISSVKGLSEGSIWQATKGKGVIPQYAERAGLDRRALLVHILDAYDGDIHMIGLTQKLSGRVKAMLGHTMLGNTAGVVSEHAWPLLKFRLNPFFQLQEKIEPWVLNAQRGASVAVGTKPNTLDRMAMDVYTNFSEKNLINIADNDISELTGTFAIGHGLDVAARQEPRGALGSFSRWVDSLEGVTDVQGTKQLNMMRTWRKGLGKNMRKQWDESKPGEFDAMLDHYRGLTGTALSDDDFAVLMAHQNLAANGVYIREIDGVPHMDFEMAISEGQWSAPQHLGEMMPLRLDYMARRLGLLDNNGNPMKTSMDMRRALADGSVSWNDIRRSLKGLGAHDDYVQRVQSAFNFSWTPFWDEVQTTYDMTLGERLRFEGMFKNIAEQRGMTPTEYLSQVYSPTIARGTDASVGSLGALVDFARAGGRVDQLPDLGQLRGIAGQSTVRDFYQQMGTIFSEHLDPSVKRSFLAEMLGDNATPSSITDIYDTWERTGMTEVLMDRIMRYVEGTPGTGAHTLVADEATGVARARDLARELMSRRGHPRNMQRVVYANDDDLARRFAGAWDTMADTRHVPTAQELGAVVKKDDVLARMLVEQQPGLGRSQHGLARNITVMYDGQVEETRKLFRSMVEEGGLDVRPVKSERPYATAAAMRADIERGILKVPRAGYWHPYLMHDDLFMQRAVTDYFGYGQEAYEFGEHGALMSAAAMYGDETRLTYLSDEFGALAWETNSGRVVEQAVAVPDTAPGYLNRWGEAAPARALEADENGVSAPQSHALGQGFLTRPPEMQKEVLTTVSTIRNEFPGVPMGRLNVADLTDHENAQAVTMMYPETNATVVLGSQSMWAIDPARAAARREDTKRRALTAFNRDQSMYDDGLLLEPPVPYTLTFTAQGAIYHEFGHVLHNYLLIRGGGRAGNVARGKYADKQLADILSKYQSGRTSRLSGYAATVLPSGEDATKDSEAIGELFDLTFNPENSEYLLGNGPDAYGRMIDLDVQDSALEFRRRLKELGIWKPDGSAPAVNPHAGKTVAEANATAVLPGAAKDVVGEAGYLYHATSADNLTGISRTGLEPRASTWDGVGEWNDGSLRTWFSENPAEAAPMRDPDLNDSVMVRVRTGEVATETAGYGHLAELYTQFPVDRSKLEFYGADGAWHPVGTFGAGGPGTIRAPRKTGPLPQDLVDELTEKYLGSGRYAEPNPDVARVAGYMRRFMSEAAEYTLEGGVSARYASFFDHTSGMPVKDPEPFNVTEAALWHGQTQMMAAKWQDAFRLQYFAQNRSVLQRSINHPMFGLYPASYMWGKIGPEMVKFVAAEPFGANTGLLAYTLMDLQKSVAMQRQFDPAFDAKIEELGHSAALSWLGYMLPGTPWSLPSSYPSWLRDMAQQGLANNNRVAAGKEVEDNNWIDPLNSVIKKTVPMTTQVPFFGRALSDVGDMMPWAEKAAPPAPPPMSADDVFSLPPAQAAPTTETQPAPTGDLSGPVTGLGTQDVLAEQMAALQAMLAG